MYIHYMYIVYIMSFKLSIIFSIYHLVSVIAIAVVDVIYNQRLSHVIRGTIYLYLLSVARHFSCLHSNCPAFTDCKTPLTLQPLTPFIAGWTFHCATHFSSVSNR